jgi:NADPH:quinone reductase-like Zn-dependent oxidoreductase
MKAAVIFENGGLDCLQVADVPEPVPAAGEVVVAVRAAALNHLDIWIRKGRPGVTLPSPHILGSDAAGVVAALGEGVTGLSVGDEVIVNPGLSCMRCAACLRGEHSECDTYGILGMVRPGAFAERVAVPALNVAPKPAHLAWEEAAALPLAHLTAWRMLLTRARLQPGEKVLIHGIGGGVALAALQICGIAGAEAIVTSSSADKLDRARELGAAHAINYRETGDVAAAVLAATGGRGVDVVVDTVGAGTWPLNFAVARKGGRIVHCGVTSGAAVDANISALYWKQLSVLGSTMGSHEDFRQLLAAVAVSGLRPVIDSIHPLDAARAAQQRMEDGAQLGKIVLQM